ncbi:MAG: hypothetical protein IJT18_08105 [Oscillospiraceae bacterium]|nr:hypothetical protein [Oscillospiraceae bacterium]
MAKKGSTSIRTTIYQKFRGVDFSTDPAMVDDSRSPWAPNMYADMGGMPCKRPGWRVVKSCTDAKIYGLHYIVLSVEQSGETVRQRHLLIHAGAKLWDWNMDADPGDDVTDLNVTMPAARSRSVVMKGALWILTGEKLLRYDDTGIAPVEEADEDVATGAYVPTVVIAADPATCGGASYEPVNLLTGQMKVTYIADGTKLYKLPYSNVTSVDKVTVDGTEWQKGTSGNTWTEELQAGTVRFTTAPTAPQVSGQANVEIVFTKNSVKNADRVEKCRIATVWGVGGATDRLVVSGNPDYPNYDWISAFGDPTYFPDVNYSVVGASESPILGYRRLGEQLAIIKEDSEQDSTVFLRTGTLDENGNAVFTVKPSIAGLGGVSADGFGAIGDEQMILTPRGVYALTTNLLTTERILQNRSFRVDPKLIRESLQDASCCAFDGCLLVFAGGKVYGLDGRQPKSYPSRMDTEFLYECFYWENFPATCVLRVASGGSEELFFGTADGRICKLNTDLDTASERYVDGREIEEREDEHGDPIFVPTEGEAITAIWATKADDDGDPMILKTLLKKGNAVTMKPEDRTGASVELRTDKDVVAWEAASSIADIFRWDDIDFSRFSFNANDGATEVAINRKVKNYKRLQILVKNDTLGEGFGVYKITKHFVSGNFAKR